MTVLRPNILVTSTNVTRLNLTFLFFFEDKVSHYLPGWGAEAPSLLIAALISQAQPPKELGLHIIMPG